MGSAPKQVRLFIKPFCGWCVQVMKWLDARGIAYEKFDVLSDAAANKEMWKLSGQGLAPVMDADGQVLADFGVEELAKFWKQFE